MVLGVDPGSLVTGYGIVAFPGGRPRLVASGIVRNDPAIPMPRRLLRIHDTLAGVIREHRPSEAAVETAFYGKNAQSALKLGQARGVAILAAVAGGLPMAEYSPREIKKSVVGNGNASKRQVQAMVRTFLGMTGPPPPFDVTDAIAVALCHGHRGPLDATGSGGARSGALRSGRRNGWAAFVRANPDRVAAAGPPRATGTSRPTGGRR